MKKTVIGAGGFGLYLMICLGLFFASLLVYCMVESYQRLGVAAFVILLAGLCLVAYVAAYIFGSKIIVGEYAVSILQATMVPGKVNTRDIDFVDIECVLLGLKDAVRAALPDDGEIDEDFNQFYNRYKKSQYYSELAVERMPVVVILTKDHHAVVVSTKLFSKAGIRKLMKELRERNVDARAQRGIL